MMKSLPTTFKILVREFLDAAGYVWGWMKCRKFHVLFALLFAAAAAYLASCLDGQVIALVQETNAVDKDLPKVADVVSYYGDFLGFNLFLFAALMLGCWWFRSVKLLRLAVATLICASLAGLTANVLRVATGRPRPSVKVEDGFYGPSLKSRFQAFPSAHTATAMGAALPLLQSSHPLVGVPTTLVAVAVAWSRIQLNRHHLSDVLFSTMIAFIYSWPVSMWVLRRPRRWRQSTDPNAAKDQPLPEHALQS